ncbi:MAG: PA14 domain-containing protein, partial [Rariglobus sp.]
MKTTCLVGFGRLRPNGLTLCAFLLSALLSMVTAVRAASTSFNYTLSTAATTSAGAYKADGTLVRTLWNNEPRPSGTNTAVWDGLDDNGQPLPSDTYKVKVLAHNVTYTWEGFIGNTSTTQTGPTTLRVFGHFEDLAITATEMFPTTGYNEKRALWLRMALSDPNAVTDNGQADFARTSSFVATDGTLVYFAINATASSYHPTRPSFITAINAATGAAHVFSSGITAPRTGTQGYLFNATDFNEGEAAYPSGLAVQKTGSFLFVAHRGLNQINVFNKTTGAAVGSFSVTEPARIGTTSDGDLWVICTEGGSRVVRRYDVSGAGALSLTTAVVTGLSDPIAVAVSPDNTTLGIADGGISQQVKAFANATSGTPSSVWTLGLAGGYNAANGPDVTNTKFCFPSDGTFIAYQADGSFWVGDAGNERYLHFSATPAYVGKISYISANYVATVCDGTPTRIFAKSWLEFAVDYSQPAQTGWTLVKNWRAGLPANYFSNPRQGIQAVVKLSNDRIYAVVPDNTTSSRRILELPASGMARDTGVNFSDKVLHEDGYLRWQVLTTNRVTVYQQAPNGFDGAGNPQFAAQTVLATAPKRAIDPAGGGYVGPAGRRFPVTSSGVVVSSNTSGASWSYHLGAFNAAGTDWLWKSAPDGLYFDGKGTVGSCTYPANGHFAKGRNILFCCHGEGYQGGQANQFLHYWDNGLLIGQFGSYGFGNPLNSLVAGVTGNALSSYFTSHGGNLYAWVNDEWGTGMHRWKISNTSSITELAPINVNLAASGDSGEGLTGEYFAGVNFDTLTAVRNDTTVNFTWSGAPFSALPTDNFSVRWSGLVKPLYSEDYTFYTQSDGGVRLWVNGIKIIDNWTVHSSTENSGAAVSLVAGQLYDIVVEYYDTTGNAVAQLKWSSASQPKQVIPMRQLYPSDTQAINLGGPTLGRFLSDTGAVAANTQTTATAIDLTGASAPAPMAAYQAQRKGSFGYTFMDLKPFTNYKLRFHVAEIVAAKFSDGARVFPVTINARGNIAPDIDPYALAGGGHKAAVREVTVSTNHSGVLDLKLSSHANTMVAAMEVQRATDQTTAAFSNVGKGSGLKGIYYTGTNFNTQVATRFDPEINFTWGTGNPLPGVGPTNYTVRWTGRLLTQAAGSYGFTVNATAGKRLWINNVLVLDYWGTSGNHAATVTLAASTLYDIKLEYLNTTGSSAVGLSWKLPGVAIYAVVPQFQLYPPSTTSEVVLDNTSGSGVTINGAWTTSSSSIGYYGSDYLTDGNAGKGTKSVVYAPTLPSSGAYDVYVMFSAGSSRPGNVPVTIAHAGGSKTVTVDQQINNGAWVLLGTYNFNAGTAGTVTISNTGTS